MHIGDLNRLLMLTNEPLTVNLQLKISSEIYWHTPYRNLDLIIVVDRTA